MDAEQIGQRLTEEVRRRLMDAGCTEEEAEAYSVVVDLALLAARQPEADG